MAVTKHKFFNIGLSKDNKIDKTEIAEKQINDFLAHSNYVYVNHSLTVLNENEELYGDRYSVIASYELFLRPHLQRVRYQARQRQRVQSF